MAEEFDISTSEERRSEPRKITDKYFSVEFPVKELSSVYQFKIWDLSTKGMCVLVREDSNVLQYLKVGDTLEMKYYPTESLSPVEYLKTEIKHISRDPQGRFKKHYLVGLAIL
jgi:CRISPR/Cas system-associated endonuclease Cas1